MRKSIVVHCKEWLDTLVVAISVAMAFRAYFYEPFNIPTGSMQETLWGYHTRAGDWATPMDTFPGSLFKWIFTGERHVVIKAPVSGMARIRPRNDGFGDILIGTSPKAFKLPTDACRDVHGRFFQEGETVWSGTVATGDFIFVNRWLWNFRKPHVGEVMIFSTTGIEGLRQGTHYIKRMKARPGETYVLEHPLAGKETSVTMGPGEYYACGDNFDNSYDSRYWGPVPEKLLRGCGSFVFWPFSGWRIIR